MTRRKYSEDADANEVINKLYKERRALENHVRQLVTALGAKALPTTWEKFVRGIGRKDRAIASILELAEVKRFEKGRIWLVFYDLQPEHKALINWRLKSFLEVWAAKEFDLKTTVKIKLY